MSDALLSTSSEADAPLEFVMVLVHPAENVNIQSTSALLTFAMCGCMGKGTPEAPEVLAKRKGIHARMRAVGLTLAFQLSRDGDEILVKVKAPEALLEQAAERMGLEKKLKSGGYADFRVQRKALFAPVEGSPSLFTSRERIRLLYSILEGTKQAGGCGISTRCSLPVSSQR